MKTDREFVQQDWNASIPGLLEGKFDVIRASTSIAEEYQKGGLTMLYYSNMPTSIGMRNSGNKTSDEGLKGKPLGCQCGTVSADTVEECYSGVANTRLNDTQKAVPKDLTAVKLDLVLADNLPTYEWLQTDAVKNQLIDIDDRIGITVWKDDDSLLEELNQPLIEILEDGTYQGINEKDVPFSNCR